MSEDDLRVDSDVSEDVDDVSGVPVLPLRDVVVYPHMVIPLFVGRERSIVALDRAMNADKKILLIAQQRADLDDPQPEDLYQVGMALGNGGGNVSCFPHGYPARTRTLGHVTINQQDSTLPCQLAGQIGGNGGASCTAFDLN